MNKTAIKKHIEKKETEKVDMQVMFANIESSYGHRMSRKVMAFLTVEIALCDISIRDHKRLL